MNINCLLGNEEDEYLGWKKKINKTLGQNLEFYRKKIEMKFFLKCESYIKKKRKPIIYKWF